MLASAFSFLFSLTSRTIALPLEDRSTNADAPYSVDSTVLAAAVTCPRGFTGAKGGVVFLIHGTGTSGNESWAAGPYNVYLPYAAPGFDICWVELPYYALGDAQVTAEYVAYNIPILAAKSVTGQIAIIGHSQGAGLNIQWALDFWPSTRPYISDYIALAGDFHGSIEGPFSCLEADLINGGCYYSVLQQSAWSNYMKAQNQRGSKALVPTTSIYTRYDEVIQDENLNPTSILPGASSIALQDVCGPLHIVEHFTILIDPSAYLLAYDALTHAGPASVNRFNAKYCNFFTNQTALNPAYSPYLIKATVLAILRLFGPGSLGPQALVEPPLKKYVCDQGQALVCGTK